VEIIRILNFRFLIPGARFNTQISKLVILLVLLSVFFLSSCSKKPTELYNEGMNSFASGNYEKALENFADGIRKDGNDSLYSGFIAANLATGKYALINSAYNDFTAGIHDSLLIIYGKRAMKIVGITSEIIPYKTEGGNMLPPDFPQIVDVQAIADRQAFATIKQQIDKIVKK